MYKGLIRVRLCFLSLTQSIFTLTSLTHCVSSCKEPLI